MLIHQDTAIRSTYHRGWHRGLVAPSEIVIHGTAGPGTLEWMRGGGRAQDYVRGIGLFHYLITREGLVWEIIDPDRWVYHSSSGRKDKHRIGIELENPDRLNRTAYTDEQYKLLFNLVFNSLMEWYPKIDVILSHKRAFEKASNGKHSKECPGIGFNWDRIEHYMHNNGFTYDHDPRYESYWHISK